MATDNKIVKNIQTITNSKQLPVLEFVRKNTKLAAVLSKTTPGETKVHKDQFGNRKLSAIDNISSISIHKNNSRKVKDAKITLQMLPDLKLAAEMVVSLIISPKDVFTDDILILSDSSDILPSSILGSLLQVTTNYYRKNHDLSEFIQRMLFESLVVQGALPVVIIPENALDDLINNYNANLSIENFKAEFDIHKNIPHPLGLLGVPDYQKKHNDKKYNSFSTKINFNLESFERTRSIDVNRPSVDNANILFSKLNKEYEKINFDNLVTVTDNFTLLKLPEYRQRSLESRVSQVLRKKGYSKVVSSLESISEKAKLKYKNMLTIGYKKAKTLSDDEVESLLFKNRRFANTPVASIRNTTSLKRNSVGEPMIKELDCACFIPVSVDGDPKRKLGGFIMLDENGNPLTNYEFKDEEILDMSSHVSGHGNFISSMNERANRVFNGNQSNLMDVKQINDFNYKTFSELVEKDLIDRVKNGQYDNGVEIAKNEDFYWLMLTRCLKGQRTNLLWIPEEFLVYFALDYDELGFGKSLLDDISNITSMRIMLMVSGIEASLRNSIGRTKVTIKLDEEDPDAQKSIEDIKDEILKSRMNPIPFGINNVADISKYLQRACYEFEISGSTALPDMQINFDQHQSSYPKPDEDLQDMLKDLSIHHFGLTKDMIDAAEGVEFAVQAATNNLMTMKRIQKWQRKVIPLGSEYIRKITQNSEFQIESYRDILKNNFDQLQIPKLQKYFNIEDASVFEDEDFKNLVIEHCLNQYIRNLYIELPSPASSTLEAQKEHFEDAADFYEKAIDYVISEAFFDATVQGEGLSDKVDMIKKIILSYYMRRYMAENGILPELAELTTIGEDGKTAMNIMDDLVKHIKALGMTTENFFTKMKKFADIQTDLMSEVGESDEDSHSSDSGSGNESSDEGDDDFDFDDVNLDDEGSDDESNEETEDVDKEIDSSDEE